MNWILPLTILSLVLIISFYFLSSKRKSFFQLKKMLVDLLFLFFISLIIYIFNLNFISEFVKISDNIIFVLWLFYFVFTLTFLIKLLSFIMFDFIFVKTKNTRSSKLFKDIFIIILFVIGILMILKHHLGIEISVILASSAVLTVVVGFALQDILGDLFSGIILNFEESLKLGDWIRIGNAEGQIIEIRWRTIKLKTIDNTMISIPNRIASKENCESFGYKHQPFARRINIGVSYKNAPGNVIRIIQDILKSVSGISQKPEPQIMVDDFQDFSINYNLKFWIKDFSKKEMIMSEVRNKIWYGFKRNNIQIPFPIRDVYIKKEPQEENEKPFILKKLKTSKIFSTFEEDQLINLIDDIDVHLFTKGEVLIREGEEGKFFYFILEGSVEVTKNKNTLATLKSGEYFGEMSLFSNEKTTATVKILEDSRIFAISSEHFKEVININHSMAKNLSKKIAERKAEILSLNKTSSASLLDLKQDSDNILKKIINFFNI